LRRGEFAEIGAAAARKQQAATHYEEALKIFKAEMHLAVSLPERVRRDLRAAARRLEIVLSDNSRLVAAKPRGQHAAHRRIIEAASQNTAAGGYTPPASSPPSRPPPPPSRAGVAGRLYAASLSTRISGPATHQQQRHRDVEGAQRPFRLQQPADRRAEPGPQRDCGRPIAPNTPAIRIDSCTRSPPTVV